jgi:hypothetical protein
MTISLNAENLDVTVERGDSLTVRTRYVGVINVDRRDLIGFGLRAKDTVLAERLQRAILAGVVFTPATVGLDKTGRAYIVTSTKVSGRHLNADLKRLGF